MLRCTAFVIGTVIVLFVGATARCDQSLPARVDLSPEFAKLKLPVRWQANRDTCSSFAITGLATFEAAKAPSEPHVQFSEEFLIWAGRKATGKPGEQAMFYEAIHGLNQLGVCPDELMKYSEKFDANYAPSAKAIADARRMSERWKPEYIKHWDLKTPLTDQQFLAIKTAISQQHPVACGLRWPKKLESHKILKVLPAQDVEDGHSIIFTGYIDDPLNPGGGRFLFRNSWGDNWGDNGYGEMSFGYAKAYANDALWLRMEAPDAERPLWRFEAEFQQVRSHDRCELKKQSMQEFRAPMWSHGQHLLGMSEMGGSVELNLEVGRPGRYRVRVLGTSAPDFGIVRISLTGSPNSHDFDLYSGRVCPTGSLELGTMNLTTGIHTLRCTVVGKHPSSDGYLFGLDAIDLLTAP